MNSNFRFLGFVASFALACGRAIAPGNGGQAMHSVQFTEYGPSSVLHYVESKRPSAGAGEVVVRVRAAGVNMLDMYMRTGAFKPAGARFPITPGHDFAGEIVGVGAGVADWHVGDHVFGMLPLDSAGGADAEYLVAPAKVLASRPANLDDVHAAAVPLAALTAYQALFDKGHLQRGQTVLIHGASGGVGHFAVQLAKAAGAHVAATASADNQSFLTRLGADVAIDYRAQRFEDVAHDVDLVLDGVGGETLARSYAVVKRGGAIVSLVERPEPEELTKRDLHGDRLYVSSNATELTEIGKLIERGLVKPEIMRVLPLREAATAEDASEQRHTRGKIVLRVDGEEATR